MGSKAQVWKRWRREKIPSPCRESNPGRPARSLTTVLSYLAPIPIDIRLIIFSLVSLSTYTQINLGSLNNYYHAITRLEGFSSGNILIHTIRNDSAELIT
jgi:hypothetical protein